MLSVVEHQVSSDFYGPLHKDKRNKKLTTKTTVFWDVRPRHHVHIHRSPVEMSVGYLKNVLHYIPEEAVLIQCSSVHVCHGLMQHAT